MSKPSEKDQIYAKLLPEIAEFVFDARVAKVFPDMIQRSVPGYATIINMIGTLASQRVFPGSLYYDLGCSLGAAALAMRQGVGDADCRILAIDNSLAMLQRANGFIKERAGSAPIDLICADIQDIKVRKASMVVLNFTLQFIPQERREPLLQSIYEGMMPGGFLVLSEKIALQSSAAQALFTDMHHGFKKVQGYSELEISQKRSALENVLIPETLERHKTRLHNVGFSMIETWFQCFNFISLLAIK